MGSHSCNPSTNPPVRLVLARRCCHIAVRLQWCKKEGGRGRKIDPAATERCRLTHLLSPPSLPSPAPVRCHSTQIPKMMLCIVDYRNHHSPPTLPPSLPVRCHSTQIPKMMLRVVRSAAPVARRATMVSSTLLAPIIPRCNLARSFRRCCFAERRSADACASHPPSSYALTDRCAAPHDGQRRWRKHRGATLRHACIPDLCLSVPSTHRLALWLLLCTPPPPPPPPPPPLPRHPHHCVACPAQNYGLFGMLALGGIVGGVSNRALLLRPAIATRTD